MSVLQAGFILFDKTQYIKDDVLLDVETHSI